MLAARAFLLAVGICGLAATGASSPPPCPLPSGGGWPRAKAHAPQARHDAPRHACPRTSPAFAAARLQSLRSLQPRGRNAPRADMRAPAVGLRAQIRFTPSRLCALGTSACLRYLRLSATYALRPLMGSGCLIPHLLVSRRLLRRLGAAGDVERYRRCNKLCLLAFSVCLRRVNFNKI